MFTVTACAPTRVSTAPTPEQSCADPTAESSTGASLIPEVETPIVAPTCTPKPVSSPIPTLVPSTTSLRGCAQTHGVQIGAAVAAEPLRNDPLYGETLAQYFSLMTPENAMKFGPLHPEPDRYDFDDADLIVDFAQAHGMQVRGHTLVWHNQLPDWLKDGDWSKEELMEILHSHIDTVVGRYRGRVAAWDVVNEAITDNGTLRNSIWLRGIGPEYIEMAFRWAHEADPDALLFYNDYGAEGVCPKANAVYTLVEDLVKRGVPIHGVGLQMHVSLDWCPEAESVALNVERLSALGLQTHITEMDVRVPEPATQEKLEAQATIYRDMLHGCISSEGCTAFVLWGFTDSHSWVPSFFPGYGSALIFDSNYEPKPACEALEEVIVTH